MKLGLDLAGFRLGSLHLPVQSRAAARHRAVASMHHAVHVCVSGAAPAAAEIEPHRERGALHHRRLRSKRAGLNRATKVTIEPGLLAADRSRRVP